MSGRAPRGAIVFLHPEAEVEDVRADMREAKIKVTVTGRPKHYYSIYSGR